MNYKNILKEQLISEMIHEKYNVGKPSRIKINLPGLGPTDLATKSEEDPIMVRPKDGSGRPQLNPDLGYSSKPQKLPPSRLSSRFIKNKFKGKFGKRDRNNSGFAFRPNTYM